jgi:hypothetical protein
VKFCGKAVSRMRGDRICNGCPTTTFEDCSPRPSEDSGFGCYGHRAFGCNDVTCMIAFDCLFTRVNILYRAVFSKLSLVFYPALR